MLKTIEELAKAAEGLAEHFSKAAAHHAALAEHHKGMHEFAKAKHEAMADDDVHKGYFGKVAELHKAKHELHKAHSEHLSGMCATQKGIAPPTIKAADSAAPAPVADPNVPATGGVEAMVKETTTGLVKSALQMIQTDPTVQDEIRKMVLEGVKSALGNQIVPDSVRQVLPTPPGEIPQGLKAVYRKGQPQIGEADDVEKVDPSLRELVAS